MPEFGTHTVVEISRGIKAFLTLRMGLTRGEVPDPEASASPKLAEKPHPKEDAPRSSTGNVNPANIVWILGSPRTGSTWLGQVLGEPWGHALWREPFFGVVLGLRDNLANQEYVNSAQFMLGEPNREVWIGSMRRMFLDVAEAKFPNISPGHHLVVKEPNGSMSAPLIMEAFPESKLVFLVRDSRDVVASLLDAAKKDSWYGYDRYEASVAAALKTGEPVAGQRSDEQFVEQLAKNYVINMSAVKRAYDAHPAAQRVVVRYEDLRENPLESVTRICESLSIPTDEDQLWQAVEKNLWENIPKEKRGTGKFHRKATPGGWREDLTPDQARIVERVTAPLLTEFYPS